jgi:hypothetical protein
VVTLSFAVILAVAHGAANRIRWQWLTVAGALTYPFYLLPQRIGYSLIRTSHGGEVPVWLLIVGAVAVVAALSWMVHWYVERPLAPLLRAGLRHGIAAAKVAEPDGRAARDPVARDPVARPVAAGPVDVRPTGHRPPGPRPTRHAADIAGRHSGWPGRSGAERGVAGRDQRAPARRRQRPQGRVTLLRLVAVDSAAGRGVLGQRQHLVENAGAGEQPA